MKALFFLVIALLTTTIHAQTLTEVADANPNLIDELDPFAPNMTDTLKSIDQDYKEQTGQSPFLAPNFLESAGCYRLQCSVYAHVVKAEQKIYIYINGRLDYTWNVSSGGPGHMTPDFDRHPDGRIYDRYTSTKFPGGSYNGLGNMPYAVFIEGGFAIHGTTQGNIPKLGTPASHGCIRVHPENGKIFNQLVRATGVSEVWITVE